jgi:aspartate racemase
MYKTIGILGGLTPESTVTYYLHIVRRYQEMFRDHGYPEIVIYSLSFQRFEDWMREEDWESIRKELLKGLRCLSAAGADFAVIAANTMHIVFDELSAESPIPLISMIEATAEAIREEGLKTVGLLGTRFTMEHPFYREGLARYGIEVIVPPQEDRIYVDRVAFEELSRGLLRDESRREFLRIIYGLVERGAEGVVLGCTEIPLLVTQQHTSVKLFDTATIHAEKALRCAIEG